jgi:hypothetical protein
MSNKETGGTAFPFNKRPEQAFPSAFKSLDGKEHIHAWGMTLRDYFAAKAMQTYLADKDLIDMFIFMNADVKEQVALTAYQMADMMLKAREA